MRTKVKPHSLLLSGLIVLCLKILQLTGLRIFIHVGRGSNKRRGGLRSCQRKIDFCLSVGKSLPLKGVGAALALLGGGRSSAELTLGALRSDCQGVT